MVICALNVLLTVCDELLCRCLNRIVCVVVHCECAVDSWLKLEWTINKLPCQHLLHESIHNSRLISE